jgi:hypothetical protein
VTVRSSAICETRSRSSPSAALTSARSAPGAHAMSASVNSTYPGPAAPPPDGGAGGRPAAPSPWAIAHTFPAQPGGGGAPATTLSVRAGEPGAGASSAATSAVPSELQSSTRMTVSAPG